MDAKEKSSRAAGHRKLYRAIGEFLAAHELEPTPENFALVYELVSDESSPVAQMILAITSDGIRFTQTEADRVRRQAGIDAETYARPGTSDADMLAEARRSVEGFRSVVEATREEALNYERDLKDGAAELTALAGENPSIAGLTRITGIMLERTRAAEAQLAAARREAEALRAQLAEAEEEARNDVLTRLPNRRAFEDKLADIMAGGAPASLAICDIDHFKHINDGHGHGVGDRVLRMVADALQSSCGDHMVARLGGEEFVVIFEGLGPGEAGAIVDAARASLGSRDFKVRGTDQPLGRVTFSAGVASCATADGAEPPLKRADTLLYEAKNGGRNRVIAEAG